jgi:hypothetical protein
LSKFAAFEHIDALAAVRDGLLGAVIRLAQLVDLSVKTNRATTYRAPEIGAAGRKPTARQKHCGDGRVSGNPTSAKGWRDRCGSSRCAPNGTSTSS